MKRNFLNHKNINVIEIDELSSIYNNWWNQTSQFKLLHKINPLRLGYILRKTGGIFSKKVLDIGCGGGILSESMAKEGAFVTGIDIDIKSLRVAKLHAIRNSIQVNYLKETAEKHAEKYPITYDIVTCMELLEHVQNPELIVKSCAKLVKPGGHVFISTINRSKKAWFLAIIIAEYIIKIIPKGTHNINNFIRPSELFNWIDNTSLQEEDIVGLEYNPISGNFFLGSNIDVNYIIHSLNTSNYKKY